MRKRAVTAAVWVRIHDKTGEVCPTTRPVMIRADNKNSPHPSEFDWLLLHCPDKGRWVRFDRRPR